MLVVALQEYSDFARKTLCITEIVSVSERLCDLAYSNLVSFLGMSQRPYLNTTGDRNRKRIHRRRYFM